MEALKMFLRKAGKSPADIDDITTAGADDNEVHAEKKNDLYDINQDMHEEPTPEVHHIEDYYQKPGKRRVP